MKNMLTKKQKEVLEFIQDYINEHDYSPTLEEIAEHIGVSTVSTVHEHLQKLKDKNYIEIQDKSYQTQKK
ncbi:MAG: LexA family protein [Candidatus Magasanikbacteria bacterium]